MDGDGQAGAAAGYPQAARSEVFILFDSVYGKNMVKVQDSENEGEQEGRKNDRTNPLKNRWKNREARVAHGGGGGERRGPTPCSSLPNQSAFKQGDERAMPPRRPGGTAKKFCV